MNIKTKTLLIIYEESSLRCIWYTYNIQCVYYNIQNFQEWAVSFVFWHIDAFHLVAFAFIKTSGPSAGFLHIQIYFWLTYKHCCWITSLWTARTSPLFFLIREIKKVQFTYNSIALSPNWSKIRWLSRKCSKKLASYKDGHQCKLQISYL